MLIDLLRSFAMALIVFFIPSLGHAQESNGGGGAWICRLPGDGRFEAVQLADLFEAREEFGFDVENLQGEPWSIAISRLQKLRGAPELYRTFGGALMDLKSKIFVSKSGLTTVNIRNDRLRPPIGGHHKCKWGKWNYVQFASHTHSNRILISEELWSSPKTSDLDRAALLWHEAIYAYLRSVDGERNSVRTRILVGVLFAKMADEMVVQTVRDILRIPVNSSEMSWLEIMRASRSASVIESWQSFSRDEPFVLTCTRRRLTHCRQDCPSASRSLAMDRCRSAGMSRVILLESGPCMKFLPPPNTWWAMSSKFKCI